MRAGAIIAWARTRTVHADGRARFHSARTDAVVIQGRTTVRAAGVSVHRRGRCVATWTVRACGRGRRAYMCGWTRSSRAAAFGARGTAQGISAYGRVRRACSRSARAGTVGAWTRTRSARVDAVDARRCGWHAWTRTIRGAADDTLGPGACSAGAKGACADAMGVRRCAFLCGRERYGVSGSGLSAWICWRTWAESDAPGTAWRGQRM